MSTKVPMVHEQYFRQIFNLKAGPDSKIDFKGLMDIFEQVGFQPTEKQIEEFKGIFGKKD